MADLSNIARVLSSNGEQQGDAHFSEGLRYALLIADATLPLLKTEFGITISAFNNTKSSGLFFHDEVQGRAAKVMAHPVAGGPMLYLGCSEDFEFPSRLASEALQPICFDEVQIAECAQLLAGHFNDGNATTTETRIMSDDADITDVQLDTVMSSVSANFLKSIAGYLTLSGIIVIAIGVGLKLSGGSPSASGAYIGALVLIFCAMFAVGQAQISYLRKTILHLIKMQPDTPFSRKLAQEYTEVRYRVKESDQFSRQQD